MFQKNVSETRCAEIELNWVHFSHPRKQSQGICKCETTPQCRQEKRRNSKKNRQRRREQRLSPYFIECYNPSPIPKKVPSKGGFPEKTTVGFGAFPALNAAIAFDGWANHLDRQTTTTGLASNRRLIAPWFWQALFVELDLPNVWKQQANWRCRNLSFRYSDFHQRFGRVTIVESCEQGGVCPEPAPVWVGIGQNKMLKVSTMNILDICFWSVRNRKMLNMLKMFTRFPP